MRANQNCGCPGGMPGMMPMPGRQPMAGGCQDTMSGMGRPADCFDRDRFPVGMGYVPMQNWETPYSMEQGFRRGTIFPSLDYPFMMGRCRR